MPQYARVLFPRNPRMVDQLGAPITVPDPVLNQSGLRLTPYAARLHTVILDVELQAGETLPDNGQAVVERAMEQLRANPHGYLLSF